MRKRQTGGLINRTGYLRGAKTANNPVNVIPSGHITTQGMVGPISANGIVLHPDTGDYMFDSPYVVEKKLRKGGRLKFQEGGPAAAEPDGPITFLNSYYQSPEFQRRYMLHNSPKQYQDEMALFNNASQSYKPYIMNKDPGNIGSRQGSPGVNEFYGLPKDATVILSKPQAKQMGTGLLTDILPHEYSHTLRTLTSSEELNIFGHSKDVKALTNPYTQFLKSPDNRGNGMSDFSGWLKRKSPENHGVAPDEQHADLDALRYQMFQNNIYDARKGDMKLEDLQKAMQSQEIMKKNKNLQDLLQHFTPENLVNFNNTIAGSPQNTPMSRWGGKTITTPQPLTTYPNNDSMKKSLRGKKMKSGGNHWDPQLGNYMSNIYEGGGLIPPGYPYAGYNDSMRGYFSGMMQAGGYADQASVPIKADQTTNNVRFMDFINSSLQDGSPTPMTTPTGKAFAAGNPWMTGSPYNQDVLSAVSIYNQNPNNRGMSPQDRVNNFYGTVSANPNVQDYRTHNRMATGQLGLPPSGPPAMPGGAGSSVASAYQRGGITDRFAIPMTQETTEDWKDVLYENPDYKKGGKHWIQRAINPAHKGYCTPMSKPTCTGHRRALAMMFKKKHGFHKKQEGGAFQTGMEMQQGGVSPTPSYNFSRLNWEDPTHHVPNAKDSALYRSYFNDMIQNPATAMGKYGWINANLSSLLDHSGSTEVQDRWGSNLNAYQDAINQTKKPKQKKGGSLRGKMQMGGPAAFTPAGSLIDQNTWAMNGDGTPVAPVNGNYYKTDPTQVTPTGMNPDGVVPIGQRPQSRSFNSFGTPNMKNLSWLLPLNAGLGAAAQANQYHQQQQYRTNNLNNPLSTEGYANGRPDEVRYGYQNFQAGGKFQQLDPVPGKAPTGYSNFQGGGETMPFAGTRIKLWQQGGNTGAATKLLPYMLRQGPFRRGGFFQYGGDLQDQWDVEDAQDQANATPAPTAVPNEDSAIDETDSRSKEDLSNDQDYEAALRIAVDASNPSEAPGLELGGAGIPTAPSTAKNAGVGSDAYKYLLNKGLSPVIAAGISGNLAQESDFTPTAQDGTGAFGVAQWMGPRLQALHSYAAAKGKDVNAMETQLDYLLKEANDRGDLGRMGAARTPEEAAMIFGRAFERPAEKTANWKRRQEVARNLYGN